jgi:pilus assembly protein CpaE
LRNAAASAATAAEAQHHGTVIALIGVKGGSGTTTIAHNVAVDIARRGNSVVLAELRCDAGTLSLELGLTAAETLARVLEDHTGPIRPKNLEKCRYKQSTDLSVIVSAHDPDQRFLLTEEQTDEVVNGLATMADYVLCDLPHVMLPSTLATLRQADLVVPILDLDPVSLHAAEILYHHLRLLQVSPSCIGAVVSTRTIASSSVTLKDVRETLPCPLMGVIPSAPDDFVFAASRRVPLIEAAPGSSAAGALTSLARRIEAGKLVPLQF